MNKLIAAILMSTTCAAFADDGFYAGVGVSAVGGEFSITPASIALTFGETSTVGSIDAGYVLPINQKWKVGFGATFDTNDIQGGNFLTAEFVGKDHVAIYAQPFFALSDTASFFGKIGYHTLKGEAIVTGSALISHNFEGYGYGAGIRASLGKNLYLQTEASWMDFNPKQGSLGVDLKIKATSGTVTLGYQF